MSGMPRQSRRTKESSGRTKIGTGSGIVIETPAQCEINHSQGPSKVYQVKEAYVSREGIFLKGIGDRREIKVGVELFVRCLDFMGTGNFTALCKIISIIADDVWAEWGFLDTDEMQLEEALQTARKREVA